MRFAFSVICSTGSMTERIKKLLNSRMITRAATRTVMLIKAMLTISRSMIAVEVT